MNIETIREYGLSLPFVTEDMAFGEDFVLLRVFNKIFICLNLEYKDFVAVKCDSEKAIELREHYSEIEPAWHWNKKYWNQINLRGDLSDDFIKALIRHSYAQVVVKLPKKIRTANPEILEIN